MSFFYSSDKMINPAHQFFSLIFRGLVYSMFLPLFLFTLFMVTVGKTPENIGIAIVNNEINPKVSHQCNESLISCKLLSQFNQKEITQIFYENISQALESIKTGKTIAIIHFHASFSESFINFFLHSEEDDDVIEKSQVDVRLDQSNYFYTYHLKHTILKAYKNFAIDLGTEFNVTNGKLGQSPIQFLDPIYGKDGLDFKYAMFPPLMITFLFYTAASVSSSIFIEERLSGCWNRILLNGVNLIEVIVAHGVIQLIIILVHLAQTLLIIFIYYEGLKTHQVLNIVVIIVISQCGGFFVGICIACVMNSVMKSQYAVYGLCSSVLYINGTMWPIEAMYKIFQYLSFSTPFSLSSMSIKNVLFKDYDIYRFSQIIGIVVPLIWMMISTVLMVIVLKNRKFNN